MSVWSWDGIVPVIDPTSFVHPDATVIGDVIIGAGVYVGIEAVMGHGSERVGALAMAVPTAGFLLGIVAILVLTGSPALNMRVMPKLVGAAVVVAIGLVASVLATAVLSAVVIAAIVAYMISVGATPPIDEPL